MVGGQIEYALPLDIFASSSTIDVRPVSGSSLLKPLKKLSIKEKDIQAGYFILGSSLFITMKSMGDSIDSLIITYNKELPDITLVTETSELSKAAEDYIMAFVERKINYVDSSAKVMDSQLFTSEEREDLAAIYRNVSKDIKHPVMSNSTYINY
jgi:hypothetical protein